MIAFLDAEFNCGMSYPEHEKDSSLIDVALIVVSDVTEPEVVAQYHSYCKPKLNHGRLYPIIKGMTHIKQTDVNNGKSYPEVFKDLKQLIEQYHITSIYVWGNFDRHGFIWNNTRYREIEDGAVLTNRIVDIAKQCKNTLNVDFDMALKDIAYICDCMTPAQHNAVDDTKMLADVVYKIFTGQYDEQRLNEYIRYVHQRDAYNMLKKAVKRIMEIDADLEGFLKMAQREQGFPHFFYQKDK